VIHDAIKTAGMRERTRSILDQPRPQHSTGSLLKEAAPKQKIKIISYEASRVEGVPKGLTEEDQEKLLKEKVLINDDRDDDEVSVPYNVQTEMRLFNPTETGLYWMLTKPGDFEKCLVVIHPHGPNGRVQFCTVIRISDEKNWLNIHPSEVWASGRIEGKEYDEWYDGLTEAGSLETGKSRYVLVGPRGNGTLPFKVTKSLGEAEGTKSYEVDFSTYCENNGHRNSGLYGYRPYESDPYAYNEWQDGQRIHIDAKDGTDLRSLRGDLYVPKGYKKITATMSGSDAADSNTPCCVGSSSGSETPPIRPGNLVDAELAIQIKTAGLKLIHDGTEVFINSGPPISPLGALVHLVKDHGFRENVARHMLKQAEAKRTFRVRVKYANPYLSQGGPSAPSFPEPSYEGYNMMGANVPSMGPQEETQQIPEMSAANTDRSVYDPRPSATPAAMDQQAIQKAVSTGQKEVFDTAMIGSMLKAKRDDSLVDKYLPDMIRPMPVGLKTNDED
jgi:hypothetical protein